MELICHVHGGEGTPAIALKGLLCTRMGAWRGRSSAALLAGSVEGAELHAQYRSRELCMQCLWFLVGICLFGIYIPVLVLGTCSSGERVE